VQRHDDWFTNLPGGQTPPLPPKSAGTPLFLLAVARTRDKVK
jgi:hypothetical protein